LSKETFFRLFKNFFFVALRIGDASFRSMGHGGGYLSEPLFVAQRRQLMVSKELFVTLETLLRFNITF
jgi:hypothetical protein